MLKRRVIRRNPAKNMEQKELQETISKEDVEAHNNENVSVADDVILNLNKHSTVKIIEGKSVALVGRAASILEHGDGAKIDSMDVVVRVNWLVPHEQDQTKVGKRTDVIIPSNFGFDKVVELAVKQNNFMVWRKVSKSPTSWIRKNKFQTKKMPTTGILALFMLQQAGASKVYMTGYDFYESGQATLNYKEKFFGVENKDHKKLFDKVHSTEQDKRMFLLFYEQNKDWIELDNVLTQIVKNNKV
jgi:hypothetical protein